MTFRRALLAAALCCGLLALPPAGASAAQVFGSPFTHEPANSGECTLLMMPCTIVSYIHPLAGSGDPDPSGAPSNGVVTKVKLRARVGSPTAVTFEVAEQSVEGPASEPTSATAKIVAVGPTVTLPSTEAAEEATGETPIREFDVRMPIQKGQQLAVSGTGFEATYNASGDPFSFVYAPALTMAEGSRQDLGTTGELLISGTIEPDADGDGFGDETQDQCPSQRSTQGPCTSPPPNPPADHTAPKISGLRIKPHSGRVLYSLSETATARFRLERKIHGHFKRMGAAFSGPPNAGADHLVLPHFKKLPGGVYRLEVTVTDAAGNSAHATLPFDLFAHGHQAPLRD